MQISISGHHVELTDAMRSYVNEKFRRIERHFENVINIHVILSVEKLEQKAEATMQVNGAKIHAEDAHSDLYAAIDGLVDKLDRQVLRYKEKTQTNNRS